MNVSTIPIKAAEDYASPSAVLEQQAARLGWRVEPRVGAAIYAVYASDNTLLTSGLLHEVHSFLKGARTLAALYEASMMTYRIANDGLEHVHPPGWYVRGQERAGPRETATLAALAAYETLSEQRPKAR